MTEEITGIDLVQAQIKIAGGATLAELGLGSQADVPKPMGCAAPAPPRASLPAHTLTRPLSLPPAAAAALPSSAA